MTVCDVCGYPMTRVYNDGYGSHICLNCDNVTTPFIKTTTQIPAPSIPAKPGKASGSKRPE